MGRLSYQGWRARDRRLAARRAEFSLSCDETDAYDQDASRRATLALNLDPCPCCGNPTVPGVNSDFCSEDCEDEFERCLSRRMKASGAALVAQVPYDEEMALDHGRGE